MARLLLPPARAESYKLLAGRSCFELYRCTPASPCLGAIWWTSNIYAAHILDTPVMYLVPCDWYAVDVGVPRCRRRCSARRPVHTKHAGGHRVLRGSTACSRVSGSPSSRHAAGLLHFASLVRPAPHALPCPALPTHNIQISLSRRGRTIRLVLICCRAPTMLWPVIAV